MNTFLAFYNENKDKIYMPKPVNYPLNYKKGMIWALGQCNKDNSELARLIIENTIYVSFKEFMVRLENVCKAFKERVDQSFVYVLLIPGKIYKSNSWVSMLAMEWLSGVFHSFYSSITDIYNETVDKKSELFGKKIKIVYMDDCSYTGEQILNFLYFDYNTIKYNNKLPEPPQTSKKWLDWWKKTTNETSKIVRCLNKSKFEVIILAPYISTNAVKYVEKHNLTTVFKNQVLIYPNFNSQISNEINIANRSKVLFQYSDNISAIIFDHKIADAVSTFNKAYLLAPLFDCNIEQKKSFIQNCPEPPKTSGQEAPNQPLPHSPEPLKYPPLFGEVGPHRQAARCVTRGHSWIALGYVFER